MWLQDDSLALLASLAILIIIAGLTHFPKKKSTRHKEHQ